MPILDFATIVNSNAVNHLFNSRDWVEWRYCYQGGEEFRREYLEKYSDRETKDEFERRRDLTPIPTYAKRAINRVKNSLSQRFGEINRRGGSKKWQDAVHGRGRGIDRRGSSFNTFMAKKLLPELLPMRRVGVLIDAPQAGPTLADVPPDFSPYLNPYSVEDFFPVPAPIDSPSDWSAVLVRDRHEKVDVFTGTGETVTTFRYYWLDEARDNRVNIQKVAEDGTELGPPILTDLIEIPFVAFDILESLMADACSYQIVLLNMVSSDSNYAIDANFSFMVRQRGNDNAGSHLIGDESSAEAGTRKGLFYGKNEEAPKFISPPTAPMKASMELRRDLKKEVDELVLGTLQDMGEDGSLEAGLSFIGQCLQHGEERIWDHWAAYESRDPARRRTPTIVYPETWTLQTEEDRIDKADKFIDLANKLVGQKGKKEAVKAAYDSLYRGKIENKDLEDIKSEVDEAEFATSDAEIIIKAKEAGLCDVQAGSAALGFSPEVAARAKKDAEERAKVLQAAQNDAQEGAAEGNPEKSVDPNSNKEGRELEVEKSKEEGKPGERGEGKFNE